MWTESLFTVYQALDWEFFSDAGGTFSHLSGPVKEKKIKNCTVKTRIMRSLDTQNQVARYFLEEHKIVFHKGFYRYPVKGLKLANTTEEIPWRRFLLAGKLLAR